MIMEEFIITEITNIHVYDEPITVDCGDWAVNHPDCDTIIEDTESAKIIRVFAYATSSEGNAELKRYRNEHMSGKTILKGLSRYAITGLF